MQYYDDNFGDYDFDDDPEETMRFAKENARASVWKTCSICGRKVKLLPHYDKCNSCCEKMERGQLG